VLFLTVRTEHQPHGFVPSIIVKPRRQVRGQRPTIRSGDTESPGGHSRQHERAQPIHFLPRPFPQLRAGLHGCQTRRQLCGPQAHQPIGIQGLQRRLGKGCCQLCILLHHFAIDGRAQNQAASMAAHHRQRHAALDLARGRPFDTPGTADQNRDDLVGANTRHPRRLGSYPQMAGIEKDVLKRVSRRAQSQALYHIVSGQRAEHDCNDEESDHRFHLWNWVRLQWVNGIRYQALRKTGAKSAARRSIALARVNSRHLP
jgi:hypothetical protein